MRAKLPILSPQMKTILGMLEQKGAMTVRAIDNDLYLATPTRSRRAFAASMSRTLSRMALRGLINREGKTIKATDVGLLRIHLEQFQALQEEIGKAVRDAVQQVFAQCMPPGNAPAANRKDAT
jgi:hypothetical protein